MTRSDGRSHQPGIPCPYSTRDRLLVGDQERENSDLKSLLRAIPRSLAGIDRPVNRNAEIRRGFDRLAVLRGDRG
jgi:hypothetical protein